MKPGAYIATQLGLAVAIGILNANAAHPEDPSLAVTFLIGYILIVFLAIWTSTLRAQDAGRSRWWGLLCIVPFGWIALACFKPSQQGELR